MLNTSEKQFSLTAAIGNHLHIRYKLSDALICNGGTSLPLVLLLVKNLQQEVIAQRKIK